MNVKSLKVHFRRGRRAVSPVVATLILIIVAIVGAVSVGLIVSGIGTQTGKQASIGNEQTAAQSQLLIGGSTTVYPIMTSAQSAFQSQTGIQLVLSQGGSDAGMQGVISGALDIGMASSVGAVTNAENDVVTNSIPGVTITPTLIGGSAVVIITNQVSGNTSYPGLLTDPTGHACLAISRQALLKIFNSASFSIASTACSGTTQDTLLSTGIVAAAAPNIITPVSRSDNSGTQDQAANYIGFAKQSASGNLPGITQSGNPGVLNYVNTHNDTIGFVDLGFAEGAASGSVCPTGHVSATACGVGLPQMTSTDAALTPTLGNSSSISSSTGTVHDGFVCSSKTLACTTSTSTLESAVKAGLRLASTVNPLTGAGSTPFFPDASAPGTGMARTFYLVTNGAPSVTEQQFISYITNTAAEPYFANNGYYTQYDFTAA